MFTMTATESGSKKLERLLAVIGARKDQAAFAELYSATKGKLFSIVLLIVKRSDLAEEIIQDAYVRIWHSASSYRASRGSPMTWMITIARNLAIDNVRKATPEGFFDDSKLLELPADGPTALETIEVAEAPAHLTRHLLFAVIAYLIQADRFGDLDHATLQLLDRTIAKEAGPAMSTHLASFDQKRTELTPGTVLVREWNRQPQRVMVMTDGFAWNGQTYDSLSKVAFAITGTRWNGPRFFGLRGKEDRLGMEARP
jgi:RNA polymerase sigma factor (sigma-70 family)